MPDHRGTRGFTIVELLVVVAIVALLIAILLPALGRARAMARQSVCAGNLQQLGVATCAYTVDFREWIPGSPNTSGWGAWAYYMTPGLPDDYTDPPPAGAMEPDVDKRPTTHVYDWATPLARLMARQHGRLQDLQVQTRKGIFQCPAVPMETAYSRFTRSDQDVPSYLASIYFLLDIPGGGTNRRFGYSGNSAYLRKYRPRVEMIGQPGSKVYLADGTRLLARMETDHATNGYACYGAWRDRGSVLEAYRDAHLVEMSYRHLGGINALFFDGHAQGLTEPESRQAVYWFPAGTNTSKLPGKTAAEANLIVP